MSHRNQVIEYIARKSLICLILTFVVNFIMNLLKVTNFLGDRSDVSGCTVIQALDNNILFIDSHLQCILRLLNPRSW